MTFNDIVWKMAKVQYQKYLFYFLCNIFVVMTLFMFLSVYFNEQVVIAKRLEGVQDALKIPTVALVVFTVFFISYAHNVFMKKRQKEFALFMTLGMSNRDISKLLIIENSAIGLLSVIIGLFSGALFSRLFFLLLINSAGFKDIPFHLNSKMFTYTIFIFGMVFFIAVGYSLALTLKRNIIQNIKSDQISETIKLRSPLLGAIGLIMVVGSFTALYVTYKDTTGEYLLLWTIILIIGLYIALYQFTSFFIVLAKKNQAFYYPRLLSLTSLDHKFKQLTSILMLITIMIMVTTFYSTLILTFYKSAEQDAIRLNPHDLSFLQIESKNNLNEKELYSIIDRNEHRIKQHLTLPIVYLYEKKSNWDFHELFGILSIEEFNRLTSRQENLGEREFLYFINEEPQFVSDEDKGRTSFFLTDEPDQNHLSKKKVIVDRKINLFIPTRDYIVVNKSDYEMLKRYKNAFETHLHLIDFEDWKASTDAVEQLKDKLSALNAVSGSLDFPTLPAEDVESFLQIVSKVESYNSNKNATGVLFFVTSFLSVLFFFGTFILLYLNLFAGIDKEKAKYTILYKIGITKKEVRKTISQELAVLFFVPTILGTVLAFCYIAILATDIGGIKENPEILFHFFIISGIYLSIQVGYFLYARAKMVSLLMR